MLALSDRTRVARCACGECAMALSGPPIVAAICYCSSCQAAGERLHRLPGGQPVFDADGGTAFVLQRKDRVAFARGTDQLREFRLKPNSPTRRVVAACCNTPMFLEFRGGHWLSVYRDRLEAAERPSIEIRTMTADRRAGIEFTDNLPSYRRHSGWFMWRLLVAWAAMGFRAPKLEYVKGAIDA